LAVMELLLELVEENSKSLVLVTHNSEFAQRTERQLTLHLGELSSR
jgi:predicted ABC-type transport system involved in lysophospholipase L1 biosynthesis ATPase subunit